MRISSSLYALWKARRRKKMPPGIALCHPEHVTLFVILFVTPTHQRRIESLTPPLMYTLQLSKTSCRKYVKRKGRGDK